MKSMASQMKEISALRPVAEEKKDEKVAEHGAASSAHGAPAAEHGAPAGHGEAPKEAAPGGGSHGEAPKEGGHGGGGHGEGDKKTAKEEKPGLPMVALDEVYANVGEPNAKSHSVVVGLELELFDEKAREKVERVRTVLRHAVIEVAMEQRLEELSSLPGKLYFKETVVARINQMLNEALIRDAHLASFYLQ